MCQICQQFVFLGFLESYVASGERFYRNFNQTRFSVRLRTESAVIRAVTIMYTHIACVLWYISNFFKLIDTVCSWSQADLLAMFSDESERAGTGNGECLPSSLSRGEGGGQGQKW